MKSDQIEDEEIMKVGSTITREELSKNKFTLESTIKAYK